MHRVRTLWLDYTYGDCEVTLILPFSTLAPRLRFSGDALLIRQGLKAEAAAAAANLRQPPLQVLEAEFKTIGETVVWQKGDKTLNVAEMLAYLCRIRKDEGYPGYGTIDTLAK